MASRYLISGVQLGMLKSLPKEERETLLDEIYNEQYVGYSSGDLKSDATRLQLEGRFNE